MTKQPKKEWIGNYVSLQTSVSTRAIALEDYNNAVERIKKLPNIKK